MPESVSGVEAILERLRRRAWTPTTPRVSVSLPDAEAAVLAAADARTAEIVAWIRDPSDDTDPDLARLADAIAGGVARRFPNEGTTE